MWQVIITSSKPGDIYVYGFQDKQSCEAFIELHAHAFTGGVVNIFDSRRIITSPGKPVKDNP